METLSAGIESSRLREHDSSIGLALHVRIADRVSQLLSSDVIIQVTSHHDVIGVRHNGQTHLVRVEVEASY